MSVLKNVPVMWARVYEPDTTFNPVWKIKGILNEDHKAQLKAEFKEVGNKPVKFKEEEDGSISFEFKRKVFKADGSNNTPPLICGKGGSKDVFTANIGNGSVCNIQYVVRPYNNSFGKGTQVILNGVQVVKHVPYSGSEFEEIQDDNDSDSDGDDGDVFD